MQLGLTPPAPGVMPAGPKPQQLNIGGFMSAKPLRTLLAEESTAAAIERALKSSQQPVVQGLVEMLNNHWSIAKQAKLRVEQEMLEAVRAKAGRYSAEMEQKLAAQGGSTIYMMLFASKARQAKALVSDVMVGSGAEKPWTINPSPKPDLPEDMLKQIQDEVGQLVFEAEQGPAPMEVGDIRQLMNDAKDRLEDMVMVQARKEAARAAKYLDDVLTEGEYQEAITEFLDDIMTFKSAFLKGAVIHREPVLTWEKQPDGTSKAAVTTANKKRWVRVDPFMMYPAPWSKGVDDAFLIERHRLNRGDLSAMIGVEGYSEDSIRAVLDQHGDKGLKEWLAIDVQKDSAEGRDTVSSMVSDDQIDALQYWGNVSGKMLREWGMEDITDDAKEYPVECWQIGTYVIKCVINPDPLARRPYYSDGYSRIPGAFWHNSLFDLIKDCVDMCNAAARALANNLGIASGPQVGVNIDRMAEGEDVNEMYPWKIWQFNSDPTGSNQAPIMFFQPESNAPQLLSVYEKFVLLADEYSGIPRYMTGTEGTPGAGRTASGLSMMVGNASKVIKSLVTSLDIRVTNKVLTRLFDLLVQTDPKFDFQGDLQIVPRGALSLQVKESANMARMQFLQATMNPVDMEIVGIEGRAAVLREVAGNMDMDTDSVVPSMSRMKIKKAEATQQQQAQQGPPPGQQGPAAPSGPQSGQVLQDGSPITDNFSPTPNP